VPRLCLSGKSSARQAGCHQRLRSVGCRPRASVSVSRSPRPSHRRRHGALLRRRAIRRHPRRSQGSHPQAVSGCLRGLPSVRNSPVDLIPTSFGRCRTKHMLMRISVDRPAIESRHPADQAVLNAVSVNAARHLCTFCMYDCSSARHGAES
jgi:hypothetical protein